MTMNRFLIVLHSIQVIDIVYTSLLQTKQKNLSSI